MLVMLTAHLGSKDCNASHTSLFAMVAKNNFDELKLRTRTSCSNMLSFLTFISVIFFTLWLRVQYWNALQSFGNIKKKGN